jgi:diketogulonate reductase-like aldo/keto reductase
VLDDPAIRAIAEKHGRTPAQVVLRWQLDIRRASCWKRGCSSTWLIAGVEPVASMTRLRCSIVKFETLRACEDSLARLGLDHVDLYLVHWPVPQRGAYLARPTPASLP